MSGEKGPFDFSATLSRWDISSISAINYRRGASELDGIRNWQGSARLGVNLPAKGRLEFDFRWLNSDTKFDGFNGFNPADISGAGSHSNQFVYSGNYFQPLTNWWSSRITAARATEHLLTDPGTSFRDIITGQTGIPFQFLSDIRTYSNRVEWQNNFQIAEPLSVIAGYQFREQIGNSTDTFSDKRVASNAGFAEAQLNLWDRVFGTAGLRQDEYNVFGSATTYRFTSGYLHKETGTKIRASYATGFRAPTINELFFPNFGNPNLRPEKSQGGDVGIDQTLLINASRSVRITSGRATEIKFSRFLTRWVALQEPLDSVRLTLAVLRQRALRSALRPIFCVICLGRRAWMCRASILIPPPETRPLRIMIVFRAGRFSNTRR